MVETVSSWHLAAFSSLLIDAKTKILVIGLSLGLIAGCFQPESGCLDIEATNFQLEADEPCGNDDDATTCPCSYPDLSLSVDFVFDKQVYEHNGYYTIDSQVVQIRLIRFFMSGFQLRKTDGEWLGVEDTISLVVLQNTETLELETNLFTDDFQLINQQSSISLGEVKESGTLDSVRFVVGIEGQANSASPDSISNTRHPLAESDMHTGSQTSGYIFNQISLITDTMNTSESRILNISQNVESGQFVEVKKPISVKTPVGESFSIGTLIINQAKWFDGIKFATDTDAVMIEKIVANTPNVFSISN